MPQPPTPTNKCSDDSSLWIVADNDRSGGTMPEIDGTMAGCDENVKVLLLY